MSLSSAPAPSVAGQRYICGSAVTTSRFSTPTAPAIPDRVPPGARRASFGGHTACATCTPTWWRARWCSGERIKRTGHCRCCTRSRRVQRRAAVSPRGGARRGRHAPPGNRKRECLRRIGRTVSPPAPHQRNERVLCHVLAGAPASRAAGRISHQRGASAATAASGPRRVSTRRTRKVTGAVEDGLQACGAHDGGDVTGAGEFVGHGPEQPASANAAGCR